MKHRSVVLIAIFLLLFSAVDTMKGQFVSSGGVPGKVKWMEVQGETYKVVYPQGMDSLAKSYLWQLEKNKAAVMLGLGAIKPAKIPVVLYNSTVMSNGTVVWAPKRMELFTLPYMNTYAQKWDTQLALHESRHVGQMTHFTKGVFRLGSVLLGQQSPSLGVGIYSSRWMLEGDAVVSETELTNAGRGRSAGFMEYYRASFLEGEMRDWYRWKLSSYRYYTPNHYTFGYLLNSTIRYLSGKYDYAGEVMEEQVRNFYTPFARDKSYRAVVGDTPRNFFARGCDMMARYWRDELPLRGTFTMPEQILPKKGKGYVEYRSPAVVGKDSIVYVKYSFNNPLQLVLVSGGKEKVLGGFSSFASNVRFGGGKLYFTEGIADPRWSNVVYGELFSYDLESGKMEKLSSRTYWGSPQLNCSGDKMVVEEYDPATASSSLKVLRTIGGEVLESIQAPDNGKGQIVESVWLGETLYALAVTERGLGLFMLTSNGWETVIEEQSASIEELGSTGEELYFLSDMDGVRNVYLYSPASKDLRRVTNSKYGASALHVHGRTLYYSSLEPGGRVPVKISIDGKGDCGSRFNPQLEDGKIVGHYRYFVAEELSAQARKALSEEGLLAPDSVIQERNGTSIVMESVNEEEFALNARAGKYSKLGHLFRFHSWAPFYYNADMIMERDYDNLEEVVSLGATLYSQNTLGSAVSMLGYSYRDGSHAGHFKMKYSGWYPSLQFSADVNHGDRYRVKIERSGQKVKQVIEKVDAPLVELQALAYLPLNFSSHGWDMAVIPQIKWDYNNNGYYDSAKGKYLNMNVFTAALQGYRMREGAHAGVFPKWGIGTYAGWRTAIEGGENFGKELMLNFYGYLPGIAATQGLKLSMTLQKQYVGGKNYYLPNMADMPRGYSDDVYSDNWFMASADYAMPVYLGDTRVLGVAYLKRLRVIPFADYAKADSGRYHSYGTSLILDFSPFSIAVDFSLGVRYSRNGNNCGVPVEKNTVQVVMSTSLF